MTKVTNIADWALKQRHEGNYETVEQRLHLDEVIDFAHKRAKKKKMDALRRAARKEKRLING